MTPAEGPTYNHKSRGRLRRVPIQQQRTVPAAPASRKAGAGSVADGSAVPRASKRKARGRPLEKEATTAVMAEREREVLLTAAGLQKLEQELEELKTTRRREVAERIKVAREFGDLSENSEYEAAKNEQAFVEGRILTLENLLRNARIVQDSEVDPHRVNIGTTVTLRDLSDGEMYEYTIVGSSEADPLNNRISYQCPVGQAVFGQVTGSTVEVRVPAGVTKYEIVALAR